MKTHQGHLQWWHLSLLGVACTIGTGFFLGSSIAIHKSGFGVMVLFVLAALGSYFVFEALAAMTAAQPEKGSFRTYAKQAYGQWAGFSSGWLYWTSEMLISGSSLTALSIFSQFWFPQVSLWIFTSIYAALGLTVIILGTKGLEKTEDILSIIKVAAIVMFILVALAIWLGWFDWGLSRTESSISFSKFLSPDWRGMWTGLIYVFFAFGGIEVMGLMAADLSKLKEVTKSGKLMLALVAFLYIASIGLLLVLVPLDQLKQEESPFVLGLRSLGLPALEHVFNAVLIIAGFSTMVASQYAVTLMLVTLAEDGDAPNCFSIKIGERRTPYPALGLTLMGIVISILLVAWLPKHIFEHIATAAGLVLLYTWSIILLSAPKVVKLSIGAKIKGFIALGLIGAAVSGTWLEASSRPGFGVSLLLVVIIAAVTWFMRARWRSTL
ncbi:amino acid permease [Paenibacillus radicis (ex Xue et al. 2023)]|uniref:Amino acid permease n=1 Tax=Paenibacillus radicis (ex Xue et al. 2023) TaxID=2972489 RepID=A0ABT1YQM2_9BACL|nr:amino acid permease [Paenibacillus radicis (ex Xue et al. 2023)]MCR8635482.1 amino acid permease [Paenibacillus radicis (ex Xue et al. 2023)]